MCNTNNLIVKHNGECRMWKYGLIALIGIVSGIRASYDGAGCALSLLEGKDGHLVMIAGEQHASAGTLPFHAEFKNRMLENISQFVGITDMAILYEIPKPDVFSIQKRFFKNLQDIPLKDFVSEQRLFTILTLFMPEENGKVHSDIASLFGFPDDGHTNLYPCDVRFGACGIFIDFIFYHIKTQAKAFKTKLMEEIVNIPGLTFMFEKLDPIECTEGVLYGNLRNHLRNHGIDCESLTQLWRSSLEKYEYDFLGQEITFNSFISYFEWLKDLALDVCCSSNCSFEEIELWRSFYEYFECALDQICTMFEVDSYEDLACNWLDVYYRYCERNKTIGTELKYTAIFMEFAMKIADFGFLFRIFHARDNKQPALLIVGDEHRKTIVSYLQKCGYLHVHTEFAPCYREEMKNRDCYLYPEQYDEIFNRFYAAYFNIPGNKEYIKTDVGLMYPVPVEKALKGLCENV